MGERGLQEAAAVLKLPLISFAPEQINEFMLTSKIDLQHSDFVQKNLGVPGVSEPAALLATRKGDLILTKQKYAGITIALAQDQ
jgi:cobalt-precorrin 5A hydrolase